MANIKADEYGNLYIDNPWYIEDVHQAATDMGINITNEEAQDVLYAVANNHDANIGINWEVFYYHLEEYRKEDITEDDHDGQPTWEQEWEDFGEVYSDE